MKTMFRALVLVVLGTAAWAATSTPGLINYQGVLRDASGAPQNGAFNMVFRFYTAASGGTLLLTDTHNGAAPSGSVTVSNGLFSAPLGAGTIVAGSEPDLASAFLHHPGVWLEVQVGGETLAPRVRVLSSAYALNADGVDGKDGSELLDTSTTAQTKAGNLTVSGALSGATVNTGQGANELYAMNQNVRTSDGVTFGSARVTGTLLDSSGDAGTNGQVLTSTGAGSDWVNASSLGAGWTTNGNAISADNSHVVGIGTSAPQARLDVSGTVLVEGFTDQTQDQAQTTTNVSFGTFTSTWQSFTAAATGKLTRLDVWVRSPLSGASSVAGTLELFTGQGNTGTLLSSQSILVSGSSANWNTYEFPSPPNVTPGSQYTFQITIPSTNQLWIYANSTNPYAGGRWDANASYDMGFRTYVSTTTFPALAVNSLGDVGLGTTTPAYRLQLATDSAAKPGTNTWTVASDARLKQDIAPFTDGLKVLDQIRPVRYRYNGLAGMPTEPEQIGVVAQEIQQVAPYTVGTFRAKLRTEDSSETDLLDFNSHALTFVIINAIQELDQRTRTAGSASKNASTSSVVGTVASSPDTGEAPGTTGSARETGPAIQWLPVEGGAESGDVLAMSAAGTGNLTACNEQSDPTVVGVVADRPASRYSREAPVVVAGVTLVKVDATPAPIARGDLLMASPLMGHAMKAPRPAEQGTVIGKALESLATGTGLIRVLVMPK